MQWSAKQTENSRPGRAGSWAGYVCVCGGEGSYYPGGKQQGQGRKVAWCEALGGEEALLKGPREQRAQGEGRAERNTEHSG